ncbi:MAG: DNA damage-inducible protein D [Bacteroidetes bacterium]|nr:DNA damage-inducible protein D [Bacteroidota bacterium]MBK9045467.1 DNA damage-inducible protein D [Bacteroidota bacterium]MBK9423802.1 DNA damage-inducible protein D [Bacteroidota bacterium]MBL0072842.1 DNA damage-inducible protein D [Bacteroidota bacterium]
MTKKISTSQTTIFESIKKVDEQGEYWFARDLALILDYQDYRNFLEVLTKAWEACKNSGNDPFDHFGKATTMVEQGKGSTKEIPNVRLTRYACYLAVQNADAEKEVVAKGQTYFAIQTRLQEIQQLQEFNALKSEDEKRMFLRKELVEHNKLLANTVKNAGVIDPVDYAIFQNYGYKGLYGGLNRKGIQLQKGLRVKDNILDFMGSAELAANLFRATQTDEKIRKDKITDKKTANTTHFQIGEKVRKTIKDIGGTMPEDLPVAESIKKIQFKIKKKITKKTRVLRNK